MRNKAMETRLNAEIQALIDSRRSLQLATLSEDSLPYASYAPFAGDEDSLYVILSDMALHGLHLIAEPRASVLIIEDEDSAAELFARRRVSYQIVAEELPVGAPSGTAASNAWKNGTASERGSSLNSPIFACSACAPRVGAT